LFDWIVGNYSGVEVEQDRFQYPYTQHENEASEKTITPFPSRAEKQISGQQQSMDAAKSTE